MDKKTTLANTTFGTRVAEEEVEGLRSYFVETEQWRKIINGDVDVVYGAKGAGKSALYSLLVGQRETLRLGRRIVFVAAENPRGTPAFRDLASDPPATEEQFRALWKLYFLTLLANYIRHHCDTTKSANHNAAKVIAVLTSEGLLAGNTNLIGRLKAALDYVRHRIPKFEATVSDPMSRMEVTGKLTFEEPSVAQREAGFVSADDLLAQLSKALQEMDITVWLVLDRLDVAFSDSPELEANALRSLFRVYLDLIAHPNISVKIFLRDDIWRRLSAAGFREASHITRTLTISWTQEALLNLIVRRLLHNPDICDFYGVQREDVLRDARLQREFFYRVFPRQVDIGQSRPSSLDWMLSRAADGSKRTAPRELIHLLSVTRDEQLKLYELGGSDPPSENLIDKAAIRAALPEVSKARYEQTLCAEYPSLKPYLSRLENEKTQQTTESLAKLWKCNYTKASEVAEQLVETGFFERKGTKDNPTYWVPFLYRDALRMVQGAAD